MKELKENVKNLQATYQDVFNISETLPLKNTGNKCVVGAQQQHSPSIEEKNNSVSHLKKTVLFMLDLITPSPPPPPPPPPPHYSFYELFYEI